MITETSYDAKDIIHSTVRVNFSSLTKHLTRKNLNLKNKGYVEESLSVLRK